MESSVIKHPAALLKVAIFLIWLVLIGLVLKRDVFIHVLDLRESAAIQQAEHEDYQGIYFKRQKIGYAADFYHPRKDGSVQVEQLAHMSLNVLGQSNPIVLHLNASMDERGQLEKFSFSFQSPFYKMNATGSARGENINYTLFTGSATIHDKLELQAPPMLLTSRRAYLLKKGMEKGDKFKIPRFDPVSLSGENSIVEYYGKERTFIHGRVYNLHHFVETFSGTRVNSWLDDKGEVIKEESPAGFVFIKEPKFKAMSGSGKGPELLSAVSAKLVGKMPSFKGRTRMEYRLSFPDNGNFQLNSGRQSYADGLLTVRLESLADFKPIAKVADQENSSYLAPTPSVQSRAPAIRKLASKLVAGKVEDLSKVKAIADYVNGHLEKRPVLGFPDALTVLKTGRGDCNEHTVLFTALARAEGIQTRMVAGVVFFKGAFYYHAWNEVRISGKWLSVDTTTGQVPADLGHIKFVEGGIREQMRIGALLGHLSIEPVVQPAGDGKHAGKD